MLHFAVLLSGDVHENPGPKDWSDLSICHVNIRSLRGDSDKLDHISCGLSHKYDIITVSETWLNASCKSSSLLLNDFQAPFRRDRRDGRGYGGVLVWASVKVAAKRRPDLELPELEALWLEIRSHNNKFLLCTVYRPPDDRIQFWEYLQESVNLAKECDIGKVIITGDLNADPESLQGSKLRRFVDTNNFVLHIRSPTRVTPTSALNLLIYCLDLRKQKPLKE